ncbi:thioredoxin [Methylacidiphilum caldifontis]|uniref:Thioredoxin n=1 Tax=Methylacidiphilum caldifontis TaxID=2795386 RepID=A0A4Y8PC54_9BACT|nr:thioredoxin [Methylacidiphilum caldifontis]QSR88171.1 thioredoxin [Methylacidiphilum caldifontis]TFE68249.1 thioredoxin [Methylacidiphilum caldifontis]
MIFDVSDFQKEVIERSQIKPVVVDFWAAWCGPCRMLSPILEELAEQAKDRWDLAKLNVDELNEVAIECGVSGIPDVRIFISGKEKDRFIGLQPKIAIQNWLEKNLGEGTKKAKWQDSIELFQQGKFHESYVAFEKAKDKPEDAQDSLTCARLVLLANPQKALEMLDSSDRLEDPELFDAISFLARLLLGKEIENWADEKQKKDFMEGIEALKSMDVEKALSQWISLLHQNKNVGQGLVLKAVRSLFYYLGHRHPLSLKYSRPFSTAINI